jgi:hypothetical protein
MDIDFLLQQSCHHDLTCNISLWTDAVKVWFMVFNATSNNISAMLWRIGLLVEETGIPRKNHRPVTSVSH